MKRYDIVFRKPAGSFTERADLLPSDEGKYVLFTDAQADKHAALKELEDRNEVLEDKLQKILQWTEAYPLDVFPEPDFKAVQAALEAAGLSLDQVSSSNMRHVITQVKAIAGPV